MRQENPNSERKSPSLVEERRLFSILKTAVCVAVQFTYGLAQNIIGLTMFLWNRKNEHFVFRNNIVTMWDKSHSMGCGMFIFLSSRRMHYDTAKDQKLRYDVLVHEYGHTVQSLILGPLFLPIIAIPSVTWAFFKPVRRFREKRRLSYYWLYCEKWANRLGDKICGNKRLVV